MLIVYNIYLCTNQSQRLIYVLHIVHNFMHFYEFLQPKMGESLDLLFKPYFILKYHLAQNYLPSSYTTKYLRSIY